MKARTLATMLTLAMLLAPALSAEAKGSAVLKITAVYYDTYVTGEGDEFVRIANVGTASASLKGWKLTDGEGTLTFPNGSLDVGQSMYVTGRASDFRLDMVVQPQWEYKNDSDTNVPNMKVSGTFALANAGDEVQLEKSDGTVVDAVVYAGGNASIAGWSGAAIPGVPEGTVLERDVDEATGKVVDTDTAADWDDARVYVVGQSHFAASKAAGSGNLTVFVSPDSGYSAVTQFFNATGADLNLTIYELTSPYLGDVLAARAKAGAHVRVLLDGDPAGFGGSERDQQNWILGQLAAAGGEARYMITNDSLGAHDRYDYVHAKYAVGDDRSVLVLSGNGKMTSLPVNTTWGNREWGAVVDSKPLAAQLNAVFADDWSQAHRDILGFGAGTDPRYLAPAANFTPDRSVPTGSYAGSFGSLAIAGAFNATPVIAPDTSLLNLSGLRPFLRGARSELLVEQLTAHKHWGNPANGTPFADPDPYLEDAIQAARGGARVRILLEPSFVSASDTRNNQATADYVNGIASSEHLALEARLANTTAIGLQIVHVKGLVVDNRPAVVGSLNWARNSAQDNREVALILDSPGAAAYYRQAFFYDWDRSG